MRQPLTWRVSADTRVIFVRNADDDVIIERDTARVVLTARDWETIVEKSPYMRVLLERFAPAM